MYPNIHFDQNIREPLADPEKYRRLVGKLIYLTVTRFDIIFVVGGLSQYMQSLIVACRILRYLKGAPSKGLLSSFLSFGYCEIF